VLYYVTGRPGGETLRDTLARRRQLPVAEAVAIADAIAQGLASAHDAGLIHGDLRPKHVWMAADGPSVVGVGIADALVAATASARSSATLRIGSVSYQSPEQLAGDPLVDARSDLYSLGCILYEMLAGEVPFASADHGLLVSGKLTGTPRSLTARRDTVTAALAAVVKRCLARAPADRFPTAGSFRDGLRAATSPSS
jgi:serine/threonine protein kinase